MIDKIQKIRKEVEKCYNKSLERSKITNTDYWEGKADAYRNVLIQFDSLQEESISEDLEEAINAYIGHAPEVDECSPTYSKRQAFKAGAQWQKAKDESITNDLGEYINELSKQFPEVSFAKLSRIAVRVAKWQKEQLIKQAIDGIARPDDNEIWCDLKSFNFKDGDKIKVIVIKED